MELVELDTAIGDGDHGTNMDRGMRAAVEKLAEVDGDDIGALLKAVGMALVSKVGGAAGPLYGTLFMRMGTATAGKTELDLGELDGGGRGRRRRRPAARQGRAGRQDDGGRASARRRGPARRQADGSELADALRGRPMPPREGMLATIPMEARKGRASYLGPRSVDHQDPGATSTELLLRVAAERFTSSTLSNQDREHAPLRGVSARLRSHTPEQGLTLSDRRAYDPARR